MLIAYVIATGSDGYQVGIAWGIHHPKDHILRHLARDDQKNFQPIVSKLFLQT